MDKMEKLNDNFYIDKSKELGKGNFGVVYKGYQLDQNRIVAVKLIHISNLSRGSDYEREIQVMEELEKFHNPNIMGYYGFLKKSQGVYCFVQYCGGGSLKELIKKKISEIKVIDLFKQLMKGMAYINQLKKLHRDLKPDNILLDENKQLKIADFGLARDVELNMTKGACTPLYAAPEMFYLREYSQKCDVWSAGLILYEMLTGQQMFIHIKNRQQLKAELGKFQNNTKKISFPAHLNLHKKWQKILSFMLIYDQNQRPSFQKLLEHCQPILESIVQDLATKYDEQQEGNEGLNIARSISPYKTKPMQFQKNMQAKLREQNSFNNLNCVRKYLSYNRIKNEFMNKLIKQFTINPYGSLKNVYKYMMMFLSVSIFIKRIQITLEQILKQEIKIPNKIITKNDIIQQHQKEFSELLKQFAKKYQSLIIKFKSVLQKQINHKILSTYMQRVEQKKILQNTQNIIQLITMSNQGIFKEEKVYVELFSLIMNHDEVYVTNTNLMSSPQADVKTYTFIRIVGHIDKVFSNDNFMDQDYMRIKKQEIQNMSKTQLIQYVRAIN